MWRQDYSERHQEEACKGCRLNSHRIIQSTQDGLLLLPVRIIYFLLSTSVINLLLQCWRLVFMELWSILFLLVFQNFVTSILVVCRHFYYRRRGTVVEGTVFERNFQQKDEDRTIGGGPLGEVILCDK
jgi:hypothetical protein